MEWFIIPFSRGNGAPIIDKAVSKWVFISGEFTVHQNIEAERRIFFMTPAKCLGFQSTHAVPNNDTLTFFRCV